MHQQDTHPLKYEAMQYCIWKSTKTILVKQIAQEKLINYSVH